MDYEALYAILAEVARSHGQITYTQLSQRYRDATQDWRDPHGGWEAPLKALNRMLDAVYLPPVAAVVILQVTGEPGGEFWQSSPHIPPRPAQARARNALYNQILAQVHAAPWPPTLPTVPP